MSDVIVRIVAGTLIVVCIGAFFYTRRMWLSILQSAILGGMIAGVGMASIILLMIPSVLAEPLFLGLLVVTGPVGTSAGIYFQYQTMLAKIHKYKRLAEESAEQGDAAMAQRYQALVDLIVLSMGHVKEVRDMGLTPPGASTGR